MNMYAATVFGVIANVHGLHVQGDFAAEMFLESKYADTISRNMVDVDVHDDSDRAVPTKCFWRVETRAIGNKKWDFDPVQQFIETPVDENGNCYSPEKGERNKRYAKTAADLTGSKVHYDAQTLSDRYRARLVFQGTKKQFQDVSTHLVQFKDQKTLNRTENYTIGEIVHTGYGIAGERYQIHVPAADGATLSGLDQLKLGARHISCNDVERVFPVYNKIRDRAWVEANRQ